MIFKIVRKSMFKKKGLLFSIIALVILSSMFTGISNFTYDTLTYSYDEMSENGNVEDFRMFTIPDFEDEYTDDLINDVEAEYDINLQEKNIVTYNARDLDSPMVGINEYNSDDTIDIVSLDEGELPENEGEIIIQPQVLEHYGLEIGDEIEIGDESYTVSGTAYFQDYIYPIDLFYGANIFITDLDSFYPVYMNSESFNELDTDDAAYSAATSYVGTYNETPANLTKEFEYLGDISEDEDYMVEVPTFDATGNIILDENYEPVMESYSLFPFGFPSGANTSVDAVNQEVSSTSSVFQNLSILLVVMTIALSIVLVNSVFKSQRREMGILKAEGISIGKLTTGFSLFIFVLIIFSSLIGMLLSRYVVSPLLLDAYTSQFFIEFLDIQNSSFIPVIETLSIIAVIITILVTIISIRKNLKQKTLLLVKNIDKESQPKYNVGKVFKFLSFKRRYQLNLVFRNLSKSVLLVFGVLVSSFLILMGTVMVDSVNGILDDTYTTTFTYQYQASVNPTADFEYDTDTSIVTTNLTITDVDGEYELDPDEDETVSLESFDFEDNDSYNITSIETDDSITDEGGVVITQSFADQYLVEVGDSITVENFYDEDADDVELEITDITDAFFIPYIYMDISTLHDTFDTGDQYMNGFTSEDAINNDTLNEIYDIDPDASINEAVDFQSQIESMLGVLYVMIAIIALFAAVIGFIALSSISSVIIDSNRKTISVMKVLGYTNKEVTKMTVGIYKWFVIVIYLVSIPLLQFLIQTVVNLAFGDSDFSIPIQFNYVLNLFGLVIIYLTYLLSSKLSQRKINHIKLAESLKSDE